MIAGITVGRIVWHLRNVTLTYHTYADHCSWLDDVRYELIDRAKLDDKGCRGAPDWVVEVLSPCTAGHDQILKRAL